MPKTTPEDLVMFSVRVPRSVAAWVKGTAGKVGLSRSRFTRRIFEDLSSLYGLPTPMAEALLQDAEALRIETADPRDYVISLLLMRYTDLQKNREDDAASPAPASRGPRGDGRKPKITNRRRTGDARQK